MKLSHKAKKILFSAIAAIAAGIACGAGTYVYYSNNVTYEVINFIGETKQDVIKWQTENNVPNTSISYTYTYDEEKAKDVVLDQSIDAGEVMKEGDILKITLSKGQDPSLSTELPDFTGKTLDEIKKWFKENGFTNVTFSTVSDESRTHGEFVSMDPAAGTSVKKTDKITITTIDNEKGKVMVPNFDGYTLGSLEAWANATGIYLDVVTQASALPENQIISISANTGDLIAKGSTLTIVVAGAQTEETTTETTESGETVVSTPVPAPVAEEETPVTTPEPTPEEPVVETVTNACAGFSGASYLSSDNPGEIVSAASSIVGNASCTVTYYVDETIGNYAEGTNYYVNSYYLSDDGNVLTLVLYKQ